MVAITLAEDTATAVEDASTAVGAGEVVAGVAGEMEAAGADDEGPPATRLLTPAGEDPTAAVDAAVHPANSMEPAETTQIVVRTTDPFIWDSYLIERDIREDLQCANSP